MESNSDKQPHEIQSGDEKIQEDNKKDGIETIEANTQVQVESYASSEEDAVETEIEDTEAQNEELELKEDREKRSTHIEVEEREGREAFISSPVLDLEEEDIQKSFSIATSEEFFTPSQSTEETDKNSQGPASMWLFSSPMNSPEKAELSASFDAFDATNNDHFIDPETSMPPDESGSNNSFTDPEPSLPKDSSDGSERYENGSESALSPTAPAPGSFPHSRRSPREVERSANPSQHRQIPRRRNNELIRHLYRSEMQMNSNEQKMSPALTRRLRDFSFAQQKRRETYGEKMPWGIIGLYDHLTGIRTDIEWAEDAAWRRENNEPYLSWADFEGAKDTGFNQPFFTYAVMIACTGCLILSIGVNGWKFEPLTDNPMIGPSAQTLIDVGAKKTSLIVNENQWFRLFSPMVLHAGIIHFVLNMLALWFVGYAVEMNHGFLNAAILFIVPAIGGNIISALFLPEYISVGASGGIFGLIGGCIADIVGNWNLLFSKVVNPANDGRRFRNVKVLIWLLLDILLNVLIGLTPFVDNFTHLGGMIYGFLCGLSKLERLSKAFFGVRKGFLSKFQSGLVRFFGFILSIVCIIITLFVLVRSDGERMTNCRGCRYVSCVPFPFWAEYNDKWWYCDDCDLVTADAKHHPVTNVYSEMELTCPDNQISIIDLSGDNIKNQLYLQKQLPKYCRDNCNSLFAE